jgi:hypothetical protein
VTINYGSGKSDTSVPGSYCGAFHDYVIEWTPTYESVSVDGKELLRSPASSKTGHWIGFIMSNGDNLTGTPGPSDSLPAEFDIRHLRVYAYSPGAATSATPSRTPASSTSPQRTPTSSTTPHVSAQGTKSSASPGAPPFPSQTAPSQPAAEPLAAGKSSGAAALAVTVSGAALTAIGLGVGYRLRRRRGAHSHRQ